MYGRCHSAVRGSRFSAASKLTIHSRYFTVYFLQRIQKGREGEVYGVFSEPIVWAKFCPFLFVLFSLSVMFRCDIYRVYSMGLFIRVLYFSGQLNQLCSQSTDLPPSLNQAVQTVFHTMMLNIVYWEINHLRLEIFKGKSQLVFSPRHRFYNPAAFLDLILAIHTYVPYMEFVYAFNYMCFMMRTDYFMYLLYT